MTHKPITITCAWSHGIPRKYIVVTHGQEYSCLRLCFHSYGNQNGSLDEYDDEIFCRQLKPICSIVVLRAVAKLN
jgi:hypothetical protein